MNIYLIIILGAILIDYTLNLISGTLNVKNASASLPQEFEGWYDADKYKKSQEYLRERTQFSLIVETISKTIVILFILLGGFNFVDKIARNFGLGPIWTGLIFAGILLIASKIISIPFSYYSTFVIEQKYGFNRTTLKTFIADIIKALVLTVILGGVIFAAVVWFFRSTGQFAWIYCWVAVTVFELFITFIAPVVIMPLFNKFTPLAEGELKTAITEYANSQNFKMKGVYTMDGSRRSTKSNAFFTGFGKFRRIALFDTLIQKQTTPELVSVLAHEMGHYKKKHILKMIVTSIFISGLMFYILSLFINNPGLFAAFKMQNLSVYASLIFFGFLFEPINMVFSVVSHIFSRKYEYEADNYAVTTYDHKEAFITALKKLSVDNLSNLTPHPFKVFLDYSHPPVLERIKAIRGIAYA